MSHSVTLELSDTQYASLKIRSEQTKRSLEDEILTAFAMDLPVLPSTETAATQAYEEILDLLTSEPSPAEIIQFRLSDTVTQRAQLLLDKDRSQQLSAAELQELDAHVALGDFLGILRAKAQLKLQSRAN